MQLEYLADFYSQMRLLRETRVSIVSELNSTPPNIKVDYLSELQKIEERLRSIPKTKDGLYQLKTHEDDLISLELDYELGEIKKDNIYLNQNQDALHEHMKVINSDFEKDINAGTEFLEGKHFDYFITDRDGTISNYCGRYQSSIQAIYNAMYLSAFSKMVRDRSVILTSAPLNHIGLIEISVQPKEDYILAGSKGRELINTNGKKFNYPIKKHEQKKLNALNEKIEELLKKPKYSSFRYIGSGLQYKFGQTTLARQDKNKSIAEEDSQDLKFKIEEILETIDPEHKFFRLEDTGKDLEIMLTIKEKGSQEIDFNKGHGITFISETLKFNTKNKSILICGDTASDLPMLDAAKEMNAQVTSIFVTTDQDLKTEVAKRCKDALIVSTPDALASILYHYSKK